MSKSDQNQSGPVEMSDDTVVARQASLLHCLHGRQINGRQQQFVVISLGNPDGSVDQWALNTADSRRLLHHLAIALRFDNGPCGPANEPQVVKRYAIPHSIGRSELNVDDLPSSLHRLKMEMKEVGEYVDEHLASLRRSLVKCGLVTKATDRIMKRVMRFVLIAVDAARIDT